MKYLLAVSGGVDSVVLLHMMSKIEEADIVVAHFDHGIRDDSSEDAKFVGELANKYGFEFVTKREELGKNASEELARDRRYAFLRDEATKRKAKIMTAHHGDDAVETVAINSKRGTGWRGLAVLDSDVIRPLLSMSKQHIIDYAKANNLEWHEDSTNASDKYLRNRIRQDAKKLSDDDKLQVLALRSDQLRLKSEIDKEVIRLVGSGPTYSRYFFTHANHNTAIECLRYICEARLTRPQMDRALLAIKTNKAGSIYQSGKGVEFGFSARNFTVKLIK